MRRLISCEMKKLAEHLLFATALDLHGLEDIGKKLITLIRGEENFASEKDSPLKFSENGLKAIEKLGQSRRVVRDVPSLIKVLDNAINLAGKTGNEEMLRLAKLLDQNPAEWSRLTINTLSFREAQAKALKAFDHLHEMAKKASEPVENKGPLSPEELKEMQESGVMPVHS